MKLNDEMHKQPGLVSEVDACVGVAGSAESVGSEVAAADVAGGAGEVLDDCAAPESVATPGVDPETAAAAERLRMGRRGYRFLKRAFDVVFSAAVMVLLCWLYGLVALAVKLDDPEGPVLFRQERVGRDGRPFTMAKFRTMVPDAEARLAGLEALNEKDGPVFKVRDDPRVTRVGRVLRRHSLDELPQFANVLRGDMSVVGPRPPLPREAVRYTPRQRQRLSVKPGLTCFWQVQPDRDSVGFDEWVESDLRYVRECSAWTDLKLILRTVGCVFTGEGS